MAGPTVNIKIVADASQAANTLTKSTAGVEKWAAGLDKAALPATAVGGAALLMSKNFADAAARSEQAMGAIESVFGKNAAQVQQWAKAAATSAGLSQTQFGEMATRIGAQLGNMGLSQDQVLGKTKDLLSLGADLSATFGGSAAEAVDALSATLRGETDPIERYGISIREADISARMAADGTAKLTGAAAKTAKTNALLALVTQQSAAAHGQFARESDTAAGAQERAAAQYENAKVAVGQGLLPVTTALAAMLSRASSFAQQHASAVRIVTGVVIGLAAAVLALNGALKVYRATQTAVAVATQVWAAAQWLLNAAMSANPVGLVIVAVVALVAALVLAYRKSETFRNIVQAAWRGIAAAAQWAWTNVLRPVIGFLIAHVQRMWTVWRTAAGYVAAAARGIGAAAQWLWRNAIRPAIDFIIGYFRFWWQAAVLAKDKIVGTWRAIWQSAVSLKDRVLAALRALASAASAPFNTVSDAIKGVIGWLDRMLSKITSFKVPKWLTSIAGKVSGVLGLSSAAYVPAPTVRTGRRGEAPAGRAAATPAAASSGAGSTMSKLVGAGAQVIVQVSDRRMVDLVDVQLREADEARTRALTRRQVVIV